MLVLSRQRDEVITIGDETSAMLPLDRVELEKLKEYLANTPAVTLMALGLSSLAGKLDEAVFKPIEICVVDIRGDKVRLGVAAPKFMPVHRKEIHEQIKREGRRAVPAPTEDGSAPGKGDGE